MSGTMKKEQIHAMTEAAVMVAMATVLSLIKFTKLPFGGSVTLLSMFPIIITASAAGSAGESLPGSFTPFSSSYLISAIS